MEENRVIFETGKLAKEKGFNIDCKNKYVETLEHTLEMGRGGDCKFPYIAPRIIFNSSVDKWDIVHCNAPTQSLLQRWLREVHKIDIFVVACYIGEDTHRYSYYITDALDRDTDCDGSETSTYEEALEIALQEALNLIK